MASLRFKSGHWYIQWRDARGHSREKATPYGQREKRLADGMRREVEIKMGRAKMGLEKASERITLADLWKRFRPKAEAKRSWRSIEGRWRLHIEPELGAKLIDGIEPSDIELLMARKLKAGLSPQTVEHLRILLSAMFSWAIKKERVLSGENPAAIAEKAKVPTKRIQFLDLKSLQLLLDAVPPQWAGIFAVSAYTGLRKGEVLGLKVGDVDFERHILWVERSYANATTKGGKGRRVAFPPELAMHLERAIGMAVDRGSEWLFPGMDGEVRSPDTKLTKVLRDALKRAWVVAPKGFSFKSLRSTFATHLAEASGDLRVVQQQLGHSTPTLTERHYAFARDRHLAEQVARVPFGRLAHALPTSGAETNQRLLNGNGTTHTE